MKKILIFLFIVIVGFILFFSFQKKENNFKISYYSWENSYKEEVSDEKMYIKVLDIKYSNKLEIIKTDFIKSPPKNFIPVIFITNKTFQRVDSKDLAKKIVKILNSLNLSFNEIQIDSDWSTSTKNNFFLFLDELKKSTKKTLSATIRLHQIKYYQRTGVPPVDYGVLMYYNMSNLGDYNTKNYILDNDIARKYHYNFDSYPLKLKLALPLYSQAVQFRNKKAINLFENIKIEDFDNNFINLGNNKFQVVKSHYFKGIYIYKDDVLRFEDSNEEDIKIAFNDFLNLSKNYFNEIIFYTFKYKNRYNLQKLINNKGSN